jgi:hypothetical protein
MAVFEEKIVVSEDFSRPMPSSVLKIIGKLAGDKSNMQIRVEDLVLVFGRTKYRVNGEVNFDVVRLNQAPSV